MKKNILIFSIFIILISISCNRNPELEPINELEKASLSKKNEFPQDTGDLIWNNPNPISLNVTTASRKAFANPVNELISIQKMQILYFKDLPFNAILPFTTHYKPGFTPAKGIILGRAYYFPYKTGPNPADFRGTVGNVKVKRFPLPNDPQYVLTGEMNGCSLIVTKSSDEESFRVWHFPSPNDYKPIYEEFKSKFKGQIYGEIKYSDYGGDILRGEIDGVNYLYYNNNTNKWELSCIPVRRLIVTDLQRLAVWNGNWIGKSNKPRFKINLDFSQPIE